MIRSHWGEQVAGSFGFGLLTTVLSIPVVLLALALWRTDFMAGTAPAGFSAGVIDSALGGRQRVGEWAAPLAVA
jgi:hypothetical protein